MEVAASIEYTSTGGGGGDIVIGGMFRLRGEITVFAVLSAGVEATLHLEYLVNPEKLRAHGEVVGWVTVFGAHKEWRLEARGLELGDGASRTATAGVLASSDAGDFGDVYTEDQWHDYCDAFA